MKFGLLGLGHLGKIHLKCILDIKEIDQLICFDQDENTRKRIREEFNVKVAESIDEVLDFAEAIDIVTPTTTHFDLASKAIAKGKHCFIEKPVTQFVHEAEELLKLKELNQVKVQIGHVERFNPAFLAARPFIHNVKFIEAHRLSSFNPRGTDVSVVHDLMIHDLDLISFIAQSKIRSIHANGVNIVSRKADICNARIEFESGLVCNVTASRISLNPMRKMRLFQDDAYISMDMLTKEAQVIRLADEPLENSIELNTYKGLKYITIEQTEAVTLNAIREEIQSFYKSIVHNTETEVRLEDGIIALSMVQDIIDQIENEA
ncbi:MAG TPA: Gfo/Idh/MocA family oxidoreductase [Saprospiraceae bacterium]|nr:Gfo/Idh/MocA family oxidoreductase [Saprospiraceae bacterium]